jgi:hypothetical protein
LIIAPEGTGNSKQHNITSGMTAMKRNALNLTLLDRQKWWKKLRFSHLLGETKGDGSTSWY